MAKDDDYRKLIHTERWLLLRRVVLSAYPLCQDCQDRGLITPATEVHHLSPVEEAINYADKVQRMYDRSNLRALCHDCHTRRHTEMGRSGKAAAKRRNEEHVKQVISRFFDADAG